MEENVEENVPEVPSDPDEKMAEGMGLPKRTRVLAIGAQKGTERGTVAVEPLPNNPGRETIKIAYTPRFPNLNKKHCSIVTI